MKINYIFACSLKDSQILQSFMLFKVYLFSMWSTAQIVDIEFTQGICSHIFIDEEFSELFAHGSIL